MQEPILVRLDRAASMEEMGAVDRAFREAGIEPNVVADWEKPAGVGNGAFWMVVVVLGVPVLRFLDGYFGAAGVDAWHATKKWIDRVREARRHSVVADDGWVVLEDSEDTEVMIDDLPLEAYQQLSEVDWSRYKGVMILWDHERGRWYDPNKDWQEE